ncbi:hypothetical protein F5Y19DRAFT_483892 [Xylariaceae sp. FL1651]|nr:hypothetical protein F5Y19DRAFT_483892 [Xylariaceae sp. FL1651]
MADALLMPHHNGETNSETESPQLPLADHSEPIDLQTPRPSSVVTTWQVNPEDNPLEPGEISVIKIKQESGHVDAQNSLLTSLQHRRLALLANKPQNLDVNKSPFAQAIPVASSTSTLNQPEPQYAPAEILPPVNTIQRRNHTRLSEIVTRLQNFDGSVTQVLAIASVQQQLDVAFAKLDHAKNQLKQVFRQFELQGHISGRQCHKRNVATRELTSASQRIVDLTRELSDLQRRQPGAC